MGYTSGTCRMSHFLASFYAPIWDIGIASILMISISRKRTAASRQIRAQSLSSNGGACANWRIRDQISSTANASGLPRRLGRSSNFTLSPTWGVSIQFET
jgi:hypothetical protein